MGARDLGAFELGVNPVPTYAVSGRVTDGDGAPLANVQLTASGGLSVTATSNSLGLYSLAGVPGGSSVTVSPALARYGFTPASSTFAGVTGDRAADFVGVMGANLAPTVSLISPTHGATFTAPARSR